MTVLLAEVEQSVRIGIHMCLSTEYLAFVTITSIVHTIHLSIYLVINKLEIAGIGNAHQRNS
jgi:hypothetical protein